MITKFVIWNFKSLVNYIKFAIILVLAICLLPLEILKALR